MIHCSGGGQTKILHFLENNLHVIKNNLFSTPPLFSLIQQESKTEWKDMYKIFNMGHRFEIYIPPDYAPKIISICNSFGISAQIIGHVESILGPGKLTITTKHGSYQYSK